MFAKEILLENNLSPQKTHTYSRFVHFCSDDWFSQPNHFISLCLTVLVLIDFQGLQFYFPSFHFFKLEKFFFICSLLFFSELLRIKMFLFDFLLLLKAFHHNGQRNLGEDFYVFY